MDEVARLESPTIMHRAAALVLPLVAAGAVWAASDFVWTYCVFAVFCGVVSLLVPRQAKPLFVLLSAYLLVALPNVSSWRGYTEPYTVKMYALGLLALYLPFVPLAMSARHVLSGDLEPSAALRPVVIAHVLLTLAAVAVVYGTHGPIVLRQEVRFEVSPLMRYLVASSLPLCAFAPFLFKTTGGRVAFVAVLVLPTLLMAARGAAIAAILSYLVARAYAPTSIGAWRPTKRATAVAFAVVALVVISAGFFVRRNAGALLTASEVARVYFDDSDSWWVYAIMPLHLGLRETTGLSNHIVSSGMTNWDSVPLFVADLYTVLPGQQAAAGQTMATLFGAVQGGGLTPGLLGGLYLDYREYSVIVWFAIGAIVAWCAGRMSHQLRFVPIYAVVLSQAIHLFHRGFLKPEYFTTVFIAGAYALLVSERR